MKPPICSICYKRFLKDGGLIYFKQTAEDIEFNKQFEKKGFTGHPSNAFWFCEFHYSNALKYKHLTKTEAFELMKINKVI
jgi:hypothetical protein